LAARHLQPNGIRAILFDLDGTLRHSRPDWNAYFIEQAVLMGAPDSPQRRRAAMRWVHYYWAQSPELLEDVENFPRDDESGAFWLNYARRHLTAFGCDAALVGDLAPRLHAHMSEAYQPEEWVPPDVPQTLSVLRQAGFTLGVLSNRVKPYDELVETLGLHTYFDFLLAGGHIGAWKPEPAIFHYALEQINTKPAHTLYVGDNYFADVVGAKGAGMPVVLLDPAGLFPEADCPVIQNMSELPAVLVRLNGEQDSEV